MIQAECKSIVLRFHHYITEERYEPCQLEFDTLRSALTMKVALSAVRANRDFVLIVKFN